MFDKEYSRQAFVVLAMITLLGSIVVSYSTISYTGSFIIGIAISGVSATTTEDSAHITYSTSTAVSYSATYPAIVYGKSFAKKDKSWTGPTTAATSFDASLTGLDPGVTYYYTIRACSGFSCTSTGRIFSTKICTDAGTATDYTLNYKQSSSSSISNVKYITASRTVTLTKAELPILRTGTITSTAKNYDYKETVSLTASPRYAESGTAPAGHGLYLYATSNLARPNAIRHRLDFGGMPLKSSAYSGAPSAPILGDTWFFDVTAMDSGTISVYSGTQYNINEGSSVTDGSTTIEISGVGQITSGFGTTYTAIIKATRGSDTQTQTIAPRTGFDFFASSGDASKTTVYLESIVYGASGSSKVVARIGTSKHIKFLSDQQFSQDLRYAIALGVSSTYSASTGNVTNLDYIDLTYGNPNGATALGRGAFDGTVQNGLASGTAITGPKNSAGTPAWTLQLTGYCGKIDSTDVTIKGVGFSSSSAVTSAMQTTWTDRDGIKNEFTPTDRTYADLATSTTDDVKLVLGTKPYTIANDKVLWLSEITQITAGSSTQYTPVFRIGGSNGFELKGNIVVSASTPSANNPLVSSITYTGASGKALTCSVSITSTNAVTISQSATCDLFPDAVLIGGTNFNSAPSNAPVLNLRYALSSGIPVAPVGSDSTVDRPGIFVSEATATGAGNTFVVIYDDTSSAGMVDAGTTTGLQVHQGGPTSRFNATTLYIDQSKATIYEPDKYHIAPGGTVLDGSTTGTIKAIVYEQTPLSQVKVAKYVIPFTSNTAGGTTGTIGSGTSR